VWSSARARKMSRLSDQAVRRRLELNPITTSLNHLQPQQPQNTPISAVSTHSLSAQFGYHPAAYTPLSAVRQYNPQQWAPSPSVMSDHSHASQRFSSGRPQDPEGSANSLHGCLSQLLINIFFDRTDTTISSDSCTTPILPATEQYRKSSLWNISCHHYIPSAAI